MKGNISKNLDRDTQTRRKRSVVISIIIVLLILLFVTIFIVSNNSPNDGTEVFKSDYVYPGETLTSIKLGTELKSGTYKNAIMLYRCYTTDTSHIAVSQCEFPIEIKCN